MPREAPPHLGVLTVAIPCDRPFRGNAVATLRRLIDELPTDSNTKRVLLRINEGIASAPWSLPMPPKRPDPREDRAA